MHLPVLRSFGACSGQKVTLVLFGLSPSGAARRIQYVLAGMLNAGTGRSFLLWSDNLVCSGRIFGGFSVGIGCEIAGSPIPASCVKGRLCVAWLIL